MQAIYANRCQTNVPRTLATAPLSLSLALCANMCFTQTFATYTRLCKYSGCYLNFNRLIHLLSFCTTFSALRLR